MKEEIQKAVEVLKSGGLILYPTDTVWGIGCDATNEKAVAQIYALKKSVNKTSMLILTDSIDRAACYTTKAPDIAWELMEVTDKPLTLILEGAAGVAQNLIPDEGTIGIRVPDHEFCKKLIRALGRPLVSTSANVSGEKSPVTFDQISEEIKQGVNMIIDRAFEGRPTGKPSSIVMIDRTSQIKIIRA